MKAAVRLAILVFLAGCGGNGEADIEVSGAWARETRPGQLSGVAYFTVENSGPVDRLTGVETEIADRATIHLSETVDGISRMRAMQAVAIPENVPVVLAPGGLHVMLVGLESPLELDRTFALTLVFERAGRIEVEVAVTLGDNWHFQSQDSVEDDGKHK